MCVKVLGFLWEIKITGYVISELVWNAFFFFLMALYTFSFCILEHFNHFLDDLEITHIENWKSLKELFSYHFGKHFFQYMTHIIIQQDFVQNFFHGFLDGNQPKILILHLGIVTLNIFIIFLIVYFFKYDVIV